ncbi:MAG: hypothetical protein ABIR92_11790, partial [Gemmatimonadaceae bacterium]
MTVHTHTIPPDLMEGLRTGDEHALEHGFLTLFPELVREADDDLHDRASAGRVTERAMLQILSSREPISDPASFDAALEQAMHQAVVREKSRLAALRRFDHNEGMDHREHHSSGEVDPAKAWERIRHARHHDPSERARPTADEVNHTTAVHMADAMIDRRKVSMPLIIVGVLALCAAAYGLVSMDTRPSEQFITSELASTTTRVIRAGNGQVGDLSLADETAVKLAAGSQLRVSKTIADGLRAASIDGAGSFTIVAAKSAFELRAKGVALSVAAGQIDVNAIGGKPTVVRVVSGSQLVTVGDSTWTAAAGESFIVPVGGAARAATPAELEEAFGWIEGRFVMNGTIREVVAGFRRWYDVDVGIGDASIADW